MAGENISSSVWTTLLAAALRNARLWENNPGEAPPWTLKPSLIRMLDAPLRLLTAVTRQHCTVVEARNCALCRLPPRCAVCTGVRDEHLEWRYLCFLMSLPKHLSLFADIRGISWWCRDLCSTALSPLSLQHPLQDQVMQKNLINTLNTKK